jgi:hypothetical protein
MLELRPSCEHCNVTLPTNSLDARICTFECTFCAHCVEHVLENVCPNCGGGFAPRPIRPAGKLLKNPASSQVVHQPVDLAAHRSFAAVLKTVPPQDR